jgi:hypothetical protein
MDLRRREETVYHDKLQYLGHGASDGKETKVWAMQYQNTS